MFGKQPSGDWTRLLYSTFGESDLRLEHAAQGL